MNAPALRPPPPEVNMPNPQVVDVDVENGLDGDKAQQDARQIKIEFDMHDIAFWFSQLEAELVMAEVRSQWLKKTVLQRNLPNKQKEDVKALLILTKTEAGEDIYLKIKKELMRIYAPKPQDSYRKALTRSMVGLPSQLGLQIVNDVCKKPVKLSGCCCAGAVSALWGDKLPVGIRAHISNLEFTHATYKEVFEAADKVYLSSKNVQVAAMSAKADLDETLPAFSQQNQPGAEVAALSRRGGRGNGSNNGGGSGNRGGGSSGGSGGGQQRGGRNNRGNNRGGSRGGGNRGARHSSNPPDGVCNRHYVHGDQSYFCTAPLTCPWVNKCIPRD